MTPESLTLSKKKSHNTLTIYHPAVDVLQNNNARLNSSPKVNCGSVVFGYNKSYVLIKE